MGKGQAKNVCGKKPRKYKKKRKAQCKSNSTIAREKRLARRLQTIADAEISNVDSPVDIASNQNSNVTERAARLDPIPAQHIQTDQTKESSNGKNVTQRRCLDLSDKALGKNDFQQSFHRWLATSV